MIDSSYKNSILYYNVMQGLLNGDLSPTEFRTKYQYQRHKDIDIDRDSGSSEEYCNRVANLQGNYKIFKEEYSDKLYQNAWEDNRFEILAEYELAAERMNIRGEWFFMGIWYFLDEYVHAYYDSSDPAFEPDMDIDEPTLTCAVEAAYDVLTRQKHRWLLKKDGGDIDEDDDPSLHAVDE